MSSPAFVERVTSTQIYGVRAKEKTIVQTCVEGLLGVIAIDVLASLHEVECR